MSFSYELKSEISRVLQLALAMMIGEIDEPEAEAPLPDSGGGGGTLLSEGLLGAEEGATSARSAKEEPRRHYWGEDGKTLDEIYDPEYALHFAVMSQMQIGKDRLEFKTSHPEVASCLDKIFEATFGRAFQRSESQEYYYLSCRDKDCLQRVERRLKTLFSFDLENRLKSCSWEKGDPAQKRAALQGVFLSSGSVAEPSSNYQVELSLRRGQVAHMVQALMEEFGLPAVYKFRNGYHLLYIKNAETIARFLGLIGAQQTLLQFEMLRVEREMRNAVNRAVNCDKANASRLVRAAEKQLAAIEGLKARGLFDELSEDLREAAELRAEHPEYSLEEMGKLMHPPIGKSGMSHRLRRLIALEAAARGEETKLGH